MNSINSYLLRLFVEAGLQGWNQSVMLLLGLKYWNSNYVKPLPDAVGTSFLYRNHEIPISLKRASIGTEFRHKRGLTAGALCIGINGCGVRYKAGGKRRSGATSIDDNAVDDAIAGEADRRSPPAVSPYTHLRVALLLQMWFSAYHGDAMLHCTLNLLNMHIAGLPRWKPVRFSIVLLLCWNPKKASPSGRFLC